MLQLISAIPTIITAVSKVSELFKKGRDTVKAVTGDPSQASTPEELQTEVQQLSPEQQNRWAEVMAKEVDKYTAQNERLAVEIGLVDANITSRVSEDAASKIAIMRMTTRPWSVRCMVLYVLFPFFLVIIDMLQHLMIAWLPFLDRWIDPVQLVRIRVWCDEVAREDQCGHPGKNWQCFLPGRAVRRRLPVNSIWNRYLGWSRSSSATWGCARWANGAGSADKAPEGVLGGAKSSPVSVVAQTLSEGVNLVSNVRSWFNKKK